MVCFCPSPRDIFSLLFRERGRGREREKTSEWERNINWVPSGMRINQGLNPHQGVSSGIKPATFLSMGTILQPTEPYWPGWKIVCFYWLCHSPLSSPRYIIPKEPLFAAMGTHFSLRGEITWRFTAPGNDLLFYVKDALVRRGTDLSKERKRTRALRLPHVRVWALSEHSSTFLLHMSDSHEIFKGSQVTNIFPKWRSYPILSQIVVSLWWCL